MKIVGVHLEPGGVGWLRCWNWTSALQRMGHAVSHRPHEGDQFEWETVDGYLRGADVVITCKMHNMQVFAGLLAGRKLYGYKLVVDTDDDVDSLGQMNHAFADYHSGAGTNRMVRAQYREADLVTAATPTLARAVSKYNGNVVVMPNCVDPRLYTSVRSRQKETRHRNDIRIYWGGGAAHYNDLKMISEPILRLFHEDRRIKLVFSNFVPDWAAELPPFRVFMIPFAHFNAYPKVLKWLCADIAIAPLECNTFNDSKSNVKYLDYAMSDIPGVYSDVPAYASVRNGETGLKCKTTDEWYTALKSIVSSRDYRMVISTQAKADVLANFSIDRWAPRYEAMLKELIAKKPLAMPISLTEGSAITCQTL